VCTRAEISTAIYPAYGFNADEASFHALGVLFSTNIGFVTHISISTHLNTPNQFVSMSECCKTGFKHEGTPVGKESTLGKNKAYITGSNKDRAILIVHDVFGWTLPNLRLLADAYAQEAKATVYLPDLCVLCSKDCQF